MLFNLYNLLNNFDGRIYKDFVIVNNMHKILFLCTFFSVWKMEEDFINSIQTTDGDNLN